MLNMQLTLIIIIMVRLIDFIELSKQQFIIIFFLILLLTDIHKDCSVVNLYFIIIAHKLQIIGCIVKLQTISHHLFKSHPTMASGQSMLSYALLALLCLFSLVSVPQAQCRIVYPEGLWPMNAFGQFTAENQQILAYYDFNRDRYVDILTRISTATYQLQLYIWSQADRSFVKNGTLDMQLWKAVMAIPADLVKDDQIDLVVGMELPEQDDKIRVVVYSVNCQPSGCEFVNNAQIESFQSETYPTVMSIQGQNVLVHRQGGQLVRRVEYNNTFQAEPFVDQYFEQASDELKQTICSDYLDIFYLDYNGDCYQDLIIYCNPRSGMANLQFYRGNQKSKFKSDYRASVDSTLKLLNVAITDINFDSLVDIVQLVSTPEGELNFQIHYNSAVKQKYLICKTTIQAKTDAYFPYHFITSDSTLPSQGILKIQRFVISTTNNPQWQQIAKHTTSNFYLRPGDLNNDGFMDIIIDGPNKAQIWMNKQCMDQLCGTFNPKFMEQWPLGNIRIFEKRTIDGLGNFNGKICKISFFDIHEDGRLDLFSNLCPTDSFAAEKSGKILAIYNALPIDAFFIKITVLENQLNEIVKTATLDKNLNIYGAHVDFYVTALTGERVPSCGNQLSHPGRSLQLPYIHTGLGRTNNYVEQISAVFSGKQQSLLKTWTPIVPNSQLIIVPGPKWVLLTYIEPTSVISILFWFVVLVLILIAVWIYRLNRAQKIEDKENQDSFYITLK